MYLARAFEARAAATPPAPPPRSAKFTPRQGPPTPFRTPPAVPAQQPPGGTPAAAPGGPPRQLRRLSLAEQQERRCQGLCYNCDDPYVRGHVCKCLFYLESADYVDDDEVSPVENDAEDAAQPTDHVTAAVAITDAVPAPTVSLHAIAGVRSEQAMLLPLATDPRPSLRVLVANRDRVLCQGVARNVVLAVDKETFTIGCYGITLGAFDLILGVDFLKTLGPILWDFAAMRMSFTRGGRRVHWDGLGTRDDTRPGPAVHAATATGEQPLLDALLQHFADVFQEPRGLPPARPYDHRIHLLPGTAPVAVRPCRYPQLQKDELKRQCAAMLAQGIIRPSTSPFSAPVLLVRKADGSWRFCIDYRALNAKNSKDKFPIPVVDELLDELHGARFFTKLDLRSGYHQVRMHPDDVAKTAFRTHHGHYEFLVMPFGFSNAPATFQALMNDVLRPYLRRFVLVFFDDILIYSATWAEHLQHVSIILGALRDHQLHLKRSKCSFGAS
ncbi:hypothetical protein U9M48_027758 [Paspalum notatum var. saurae]|uniref:Reverse transcriptase domain-containing protein n=1 Tax=Paspalum notatum var. saurae TaxID=547442 RepID=A0AAQ3U029_PASNO